MLEYFKKLASLYKVPLDNVISIALNRYGIVMDNTLDNRLRFDVEILDTHTKNFFAVCVNTYPNSPFKLVDDKLYLDNEVIAKVSNIEKDTCTATYFRNNKKAITFNSNSRSKCAGCKFCGTYSLSEDDSYDFSKVENVIAYFTKLLKENNISGMEKLESVTICTGCFPLEDDLIKHLYTVNEAFIKMGYKGSLNYIGSQLTSYDKIKEISQNINDFGMYLTIEKFLDRDKFMRPEKASLTLDKAKDLLEYASSLGITTTFLYILGLESLEAIQTYFTYFKDSINKFPVVQVFQDYTKEQENYRIEEAKDIEYYLQAKQIIKDIYKDTGLAPKLWESYRGLYTSKDFQGRKLLR